MAKGAYIGVDGKARKVKKMYIGVNNVARKVKKGYIGINGVARQFFSGEPEAKYYGPVTALQNAGSEFGSLANQNYAIFWKDKSGSDAYNKSLVKTLVELPSSGSYSNPTTDFGNYGVGFYPPNRTATTAFSVNTSLVSQTIATIDSRHNYTKALKVGNSAILAGGSYAESSYLDNSVRAISSSLLITEVDTLPNVRNFMMGSFNENYAVYAGGQDRDEHSANDVYAYNSSYTRTDLGTLSIYPGSGTFTNTHITGFTNSKDHAIFFQYTVPGLVRSLTPRYCVYNKNLVAAFGNMPISVNNGQFYGYSVWSLNDCTFFSGGVGSDVDPIWHLPH